MVDANSHAVLSAYGMNSLNRFQPLRQQINHAEDGKQGDVKNKGEMFRSAYCTMSH